MQAPSRRLGEFLIERKVLSRDALEELLDREQREGVPLSKLLMGEGMVGEKDLVAAVAAQVGLPFVDFEQSVVNPTLDHMIPTELARAHLAVAVDVDGSDLLVAMVDPSNKEAIAELEQATNWTIKPALAVRSELERVVGAMYGLADPAHEGDIEIAIDEEAAASAETPEEGRPDLHVNDLLERVVDLAGSDLHLATGLPPVVRVHGELKPLTEFPIMTPSEIRRMIYAILTQKQRERFENDLELDTSHSVPGLGRFRVNVFLQRDAVGSVMRAIPTEVVPFDHLGLPPAVLQFAGLPRGLILLTGPTGSGKSTTLASLIDIVNAHKACHIMTVEDPIEFLHRHKMAVVNQREVGEDTYSFAAALKHVLRQDPDVILVGETRDLETAQIAIRAALTGHLVFSTLHTNDAPGTIARLQDMGIPPFLVASSILLVLAQRLARKVCKECRDPYEADEESLTPYGHVPQGLGRVTLYKGKGCQACNFTGMKGRIAIYEVMPISLEIRELILRGASANELRDLAVQQGMKTLRQAGLLKVLEGVITAEEILRVTIG